MAPEQTFARSVPEQSAIARCAAGHITKAVPAPPDCSEKDLRLPCLVTARWPPRQFVTATVKARFGAKSLG
jgi:hypothetical protein